MILGVVLGHIAELNLSRALAISDDLGLFVTRPWSLFFLIIAGFSLVFPWYQAARDKARWTLAYIPLLMIAVSGPLFLMVGAVRPVLGGALLLGGAALLWQRGRRGWQPADTP